MPESRTADPSLFKAPRRMSAVEMVIENIKELLVTKQLKPGDKLPNEMDLAKSLSASRGSVREAMKILASFGILEIKRGDGTYISDSTSKTSIDHILFQLIMSDADKQKLVELRELIETGIIKIILSNADEGDIARIEKAFHLLENLVKEDEHDIRVLTEADLEFHRALGKATKNELIEKIYNFTLDLFEPSIRETQTKPGGSAVGVRVHKKILEGIKEHNPEKSQEAIKGSISAWVEMQ